MMGAGVNVFCTGGRESENGAADDPDDVEATTLFGRCHLIGLDLPMTGYN